MRIAFLMLTILAGSILSGCSGSNAYNMSGYVIGVQPGELLVVWGEGVSRGDVGNLTTQEILDKAAPNAVKLRYKEAESFKVGDKVLVRTEGAFADSYPALATAQKVKLDES